MPERNMTPQKTPMPTQPADERNHNFSEVALGYTYSMAVSEARRCLSCKNSPCVAGCPVKIDIPGFIRKIAEEDMDGSFEILSASTSLPAVCGRVCPQETQCENLCVRAIKGESVGIGRLERFAADWHREHNSTVPRRTPHNGHSVAVVGAGPSGLTCAGDLARYGYQVTVFEALHLAGGVLVYGIPEFRLPKAVVKREVDALRTMGVEFYTNWVGGKTITIRELFLKGYKAVFVATGAGLPRFLGVPGDSLVGVFSANEYLTRANLGRAFAFPKYGTPIFPATDVVVVGGGNVAMDAARTALRLGAKHVTIAYRRTREEMPARREEAEHAEEEGVHFEYLANPVELQGDKDGKLANVRVQRQVLGEPDASGRRKPMPTDEYFDIPAQLAIIAVGTRANKVLLEATPDLQLNKWGYITVNEETGETSIPNVFAGGLVVSGSAAVISAMHHGRRAAREIARRFLVKKSA